MIYMIFDRHHPLSPSSLSLIMLVTICGRVEDYFHLHSSYFIAKSQFQFPWNCPCLSLLLFSNKNKIQLGKKITFLRKYILNQTYIIFQFVQIYLMQTKKVLRFCSGLTINLPSSKKCLFRPSNKIKIGRYKAIVSKTLFTIKRLPLTELKVIV